MDDVQLLTHYLELGHEPWNLSPEAAYLDFLTRRWLRASWPTAPIRALNVGIGAGRWDDYIAHLAQPDSTLTSIDIDPAICDLLQYRQRREAHPHPAQVICTDLLADTLPAAAFDLVTAIGSTLREIDAAHPARALPSLARLVAPGGQLLLHADHHTIDPEQLRRAVDQTGLRLVDLHIDEGIPAMPQSLLRAIR
jgi:SAM-dependent methyltransferase